MKYFFSFLLSALLSSTFGQPNNLYNRFNKGSFDVGFIELQTKDYSRIYKDDFRTIQIALWYPITNSEGEKVKIIDYLNLYNSEDKYQDKVNIKDFWENQFLGLNKNISADKLLGANTLAYFAPMPLDSKYPLILYAAGGQGESFENFLICEILASHGFVVAAIPSIGTYIHPIENNKEGLMTQTQDLQTVLRQLNQEPFVDFNNVGAFGWSWGGLSALYLQTLYPNIKSYISLDGSIAEYGNVIEKMPFYGIEKITAPGLYFATSEDTKIRARNFVDQLIYANSTFISLDSIEHSNFNCYSYLAQVFNSVNPNQSILKFYPYLTNTICDFFSYYLKEGKKDNFKVKNDLSIIDTISYKKGVETPLREDQLITLIKDKGQKAGLIEYKKMKKLNPNYIPFQAFELTKLAFSLQHDSLRSDESIPVMDMVIDEYPESASSYALRGRIHELRKEYKEALMDFKKALSLKKDSIQPAEAVFYEDINWYKKKIDELENKKI